MITKNIGILLSYLLLIIAGVAAAIWFASLPPTSRQHVLNGMTGIATLIVIQPAIFFSVKVANASHLSKTERAIWLAITATLGGVLPVFAIAYLQSFVSI